jgi:hypothetical protein
MENILKKGAVIMHDNNKMTDEPPAETVNAILAGAVNVKTKWIDQDWFKMQKECFGLRIFQPCFTVIGEKISEKITVNKHKTQFLKQTYSSVEISWNYNHQTERVVWVMKQGIFESTITLDYESEREENMENIRNLQDDYENLF